MWLFQDGEEIGSNIQLEILHNRTDYLDYKKEVKQMMEQNWRSLRWCLGRDKGNWGNVNLNPGTIVWLSERRERAIYKCSLVDTSAWLEQNLDCLLSIWQIAGGELEAVTDFLFLDSKFTADGDCSHEIRRCLLLGRKAMINLDNILKSRDITLLTKVHLVKAMFFSSRYVWMWHFLVV